MALQFTNPVHFETFKATMLSSCKLISGTRKADNTPYQLLEATAKSNGAITAIRISNNLSTEELKAKKSQLILSEVLDTDTSETFQMVYLKGERIEEDF